MGCDNGVNLADICNSNEQICKEFNEDSWCKTERINTIFANNALQINKQDSQKYDLLLAYESYAKCVRFSAKIEHIKLKEKRTLRVNNYMKAEQRIQVLSKETETSEHPSLLYYHWSRYLNEASLNKFLRMEGSSLLETPNSQFDLATYYVKIDKKKTMGLLLHALELYKPQENINIEILKSLSTLFNNEKKAKQAYIWLKTLHIYIGESEEVTTKTLYNFADSYELDQAFLDKVAEETLKNIKLGKFVAPSF